MLKKILSLGLSLLMVWFNTVAVFASTIDVATLSTLVNKPYVELLEITPKVNFPEKEINDFKKNLEKEKASEKIRLEKEEAALKKQVVLLEQQLDKLNKKSSTDTQEMEKERQSLHCQILTLERTLKQKHTEHSHGLSVIYDNKLAKLELIQKWPLKQKEIEQFILSGNARSRRFGNVEDIGIRKVGEGQEKDIRLGEESLQQLKSTGLMPPEIEDKELIAYVQGLADLVAANSDLRVPVRVFLLDSDEINAFALPGGFLFINRGLIEKASNESELVGVISHELAHVSARHGARLMKKATIAGIFYQAAQVAAVLLTGGIAGIGMYYALNYGFFGLGLVLDLTLLGVCRDYEMEADQLGTQYAWRSGYDPKGFITFFDKMASEKGYVRSASFFRTHPAFFDRIVSTFSEISYLPPKDELIMDSTDFHLNKEKLVKIAKSAKEERSKKAKASLKKPSPCDE
ncbi:MAG: M48 family metalloprotease [Acidobacteria bacterium]|nr:M48 family metalloprotease [Acidobacteriota bacterium]